MIRASNGAQVDLPERDLDDHQGDHAEDYYEDRGDDDELEDDK